MHPREILRKIRRLHVEKALASIAKDGVPEKRHSPKYSIRSNRNKKRYPPSYTLVRAGEIATRETLKTGDFRGGKQEALRILESLLDKKKFGIVNLPSN